MKKSLMLVALVATVLMTACNSSKKVADPKNSPFGDVYEMPATEIDTEEYFGATGIAYGPQNRMDVLQTTALTNAQNIIRQKMSHAYKGAIDDYSNYMGNSVGNDAVNKVERAGTQVIDAIIGETQASKGPLFSAVDDKGNVTCYVGIRIYKKTISDKVAERLSKDEELKIRFDEEQFRKRMEESFEKFKENK